MRLRVAKNIVTFEFSNSNSTEVHVGYTQMSSYTKDEVMDKILSGDLCLIQKSTTDKSSACWDKFMLIVNSQTNVSVGFVQCKMCKAILVYKTSTSGMKRHNCIVTTNATSNTIVLKEDKNELRDTCVLMCTKDLRPFNFVGGEGFLKVAQVLINIGAKYGKIDAASVVPHRSTVSRHINEVACKLRQAIIPKVKNAIALKQCAFTSDLWTDNYRKLHYLTVTSSYIEESEHAWELKTNVLFTSKFPDITKTGEHILLEMQEQLAAIDIMPSELDNVTFVTDQGSNIRKALEKYKRIPCLAHCLSTTLRHTLDEHFLKEEISDVSLSIESARKLVGFMKRSGLVSQLGRTLLQSVETRWNSVFMLLNSVHSQYEEIKTILLGKNHEHMIQTYNKLLMEDIITFLKNFKDATDDLEKEKEPTIAFAVPWIKKLLKNCNVVNTDSEALVKIKTRAERFLMEKVYNELTNIHYIGTFLHPTFKALIPLSSEKRQQIHETVRQMCNGLGMAEQKDCDLSSSQKTFQEWISPTFYVDEVERYVCMHVSEIGDILQWWRTHSDFLPQLATIAKRIFSIPCTSAASERNFSKAGLLITQRRSTINPDHVNDILFIHNTQ